MRILSLGLVAILGLHARGFAQTLAQPSWSKKLNARTVFITGGWQYEMELARAAHVIASLQVSSQTDWEDPVNPAAALSVSVDGRLASHVITYMGREFHHYEIHLGLITPGVRVLEITRLDSAHLDVRLVEVRVDAYEEDHAQFPVLAHAPVIFGRKEMRYSDLPLLLAHEVRWFEALPGQTPRMKAIEYTVVYSNEAGGTPPAGLLHKWGRYSDIEWAYRVEFERDGKTRKRAYFQGPEHKTLPFRGGYENDQPALQVATLNNMLIDTLNTKLRFALPPRYRMPDDGLRERLMLQAPWSWRVCAKEARREQRQEKTLTDTTRLADLKNYLFIQFAAHPQIPETECGGFFIAKFRRHHGEYVSHLWSPRLVIRSRQPFVRQTALPMPGGVTPEDLVRLDFVANAASDKTVLTEIVNVFALDHNDLPRIWPPGWRGAIALDPGERVSFHVDGFQLLPERILPLAEAWSFQVDSLLQGDREGWNDAAFNDQAWPLLRTGVSWEQQGYSGYRGVAWYRTHFKPDQSWRSEKMLLGLGITGNFALWCNGKPLSPMQLTESSEEDPKIFDLTPHVQVGKGNVLALRVDGREQPGGLIAKPAGLINLVQALAQPLPAAMADPGIDEGEPFDYFALPSAFLGTLENGVSAQITPEGSLYNGAVELMFYGGAALQPLNAGRKTLLQGYFPVLQYQTAKEGIDYRFEAFALPMADSAAQHAMNYLQVTLSNNTNAPRHTRFAVGMRFRGAEQRLPAQAPFDPLWHYRLVGKFVHRNQEVLCSVSTLPHSVQFSPLGAAHRPESITGMMEYQFTLAPGEVQRVSLCVPQKPASSERMRAAQGLTFDCDRLREDAVRYWQKFLQAGAAISVAEDKVNHLWRAQLIYSAIFFGPGAGRDGRNPWHQYPLSRLATAASAFDAAGHHHLAQQALRSGFEKIAGSTMAANGMTEENRTPASGWAELLAALAGHLQVTADHALLAEAMPAIRMLLLELEKSHKQNSSSARRQEDLPLALMGLRHAQNLARRAGEQETESLADRLYSYVEKEYRPGLEAFGKKKNEKEARPVKRAGERMVAAAVYPANILPAGDKRAAAALQALRGDFEEGLATRPGQWLDPGFTFDLAHAALQSREPETALQDFYALALHTSAAHLLIGEHFRAWSTRQNQSPETVLEGVRGEFVLLMRDLFVREEGRDLFLFEAVSPAWFLQDNRLEIRDVVTAFGKHSVQATSSAEELVMDFEHQWRTPPRRILLRVPEFVEALSARIDGQAVPIEKGYITVPPLSRRVEMQWRNHAAQEPVGYEQTVARFKREYAGRYEMWKREHAAKN